MLQKKLLFISNSGVNCILKVKLKLKTIYTEFNLEGHYYFMSNTFLIVSSI